MYIWTAAQTAAGGYAAPETHLCVNVGLAAIYKSVHILRML